MHSKTTFCQRRKYWPLEVPMINPFFLKKSPWYFLKGQLLQNYFCLKYMKNSKKCRWPGTGYFSYFWPYNPISVASKGQKLRTSRFILALKPRGRISNQFFECWYDNLPAKFLFRLTPAALYILLTIGRGPIMTLEPESIKARQPSFAAQPTVAFLDG